MVYLFLANGFEESEALVPTDVLRRAGIELTIVGVGGLELTGSHGVTVKADITAEMLPETPDFEAIVLPGGYPGYENLKKCGTVKKWTEYGVKRGIPVAAICAAPSLLYEWGLLSGPSTVFPNMKQTVGEYYTPQAVVWSAPVLTGNAAGASFDFALALVEQLRGRQAAEQTAEALHYPHMAKGAKQ